MTTRTIAKSSLLTHMRKYHRYFAWFTTSIRAKMLGSLVLLLLLTNAVTTIVLLLGTGAIRERLVDQQLTVESQLLEEALAQSERNAVETLNILTSDPLLIAAISQAHIDGEFIVSERLYESITAVRDRFEVEQMLVIDTERQLLINETLSGYEAVDEQGHFLLPRCVEEQRILGAYANTRLLISCAPIRSETATPIAFVYVIFDLPVLFQRLQETLALQADLGFYLSDQRISMISTQSAGNRSFFVSTKSRDINVPLGDGQVRMSLRVSRQDVDEIINASVQVTLISSGLTLLALLLGVIWLARRLTHPILKLSAVAQAVADGDLSQRANLVQQDEIGLLGRSLDQATDRIMTLFQTQERMASERHAILQSIADGVLAIDKQAYIVMINPAAAALLKQDATRLQGQPLTRLQLTDDPVFVVGIQQIIQRLQKELSRRHRGSSEERISLGERIVRLRSAPIMGQQGTKKGAVVVIQDVTMMVESEQAKSAFIATASHELRTPLTSLRGFVDLLSRSDRTHIAEMQNLAIDTIKRQTDSLIVLVNDLLEMARLEQGEQLAENSAIDPTAIIGEVVTMLHRFAEQRQIQLVVAIAPDLPSLWIDPVHLRRILTNLVSNAIKYSYPEQAVHIRATLLDDPTSLPSQPYAVMPWVHSQERSVLIAVEDRGVGIRASDQPALFTRFFRSENPLSVEVGGTGLGLAITRSLVTIHQGQIGFWSKENEGSCFWVRLPAHETAAVLAKEREFGQQTVPVIDTC